jgi:predicted transport protein
MNAIYDTEVTKFLNVAAIEANVSVSDLLRRILHLDSLNDDPRFSRLFGSMPEATKVLLMKLDFRLRVLNPGLHYVFRSMYLGYRREDGHAGKSSSERSQIFASIVPRHRRLRVILPVDPTAYLNLTDCRALSGQGHHGVGDLLVELADEVDLERFFTTFRGWLGDPSHGVT